MGSNLLAALAAAGILERTGPGRAVLRASPRFLAHAEGTAGRLRLQGRSTGAEAALEAALVTWDGYRHSPLAGARFLREFLEERNQLGAVVPVFPALETFTPQAAVAVP